MMVTQNVFVGLGIVRDPHRNTIRGSGRDRNVGDLIWWKKMTK